jgi:TRAP-type C4-dicarboxylate transport system permease small subunit
MGALSHGRGSMSQDPKSIGYYLEEQERSDDEAQHGKPIGLADIPALLVFTALFFVVFLQFFTRYVLNDSLAWTEEAARYLLIVLVFYGVIKCELLDSHIRLEFIDQALERHLKMLKQAAALLSMFYYGSLTYALFLLAKATSFQSMVSLPFPKYYLYILISVALVSLIAVQLSLFFKRLLGDQK